MFCKKNHIILLCLSSYSIDLLQSLNVEVFLSLIIIYKLKLKAFTWLNAEYLIDKLNFIKLYLQAQKIALTTSNIQSAWVKSDLTSLNCTIVLSKLSIIIKSHSITSSDITIQSSSDVSFSISFISFNAIEMNMLMKQTINNDDFAAEAQALKKLVKTCKSVYVTSVFLQSTNEDLLLAACYQHC